MKTVYLHIGCHKTGTTAIQGFLSVNEDVLRERGCLYAKSCRVRHNPDMTTAIAFAHHRLPLSILDGDEAGPEELRKEIEESPCATAIVSTEVFMARFKKNSGSFEKLRSLFKDFDVKIIIYLRPQDTLYESIYNQQIKDSFVAIPLNPEELPPYFDYLHWIRLWGRYFGDSNIIVRPYEKAQFVGGSLVSDFLAAVGIDVRLDELKPPPPGTNPRLNRDTLFFKNLVNQLNVDKSVKNACNGPLLHMSREREPQTGSAFHDHGLLAPAERRAISHRYREQNSVIARVYLGRADGRLFVTEPPPMDLAEPAADHRSLTPDVAATIADGLLKALRPELGDAERQGQLTFGIVKSAISLLDAKPTESATRETVENLQALVQHQQLALDILRARHADALYKIAQLTEAVTAKAKEWSTD